MDIFGTIINFYTYRSALVSHSFYINLDKYQREELKEWIKSENYQFDNHICWETNEGLCYRYSDGTLYIGTSITKKNW